MIRRIDLRGQALSNRALVDALPRPELSVDNAAEIVAPILADVRVRGAAALRDLSERFDGTRPEYLRVPQSAIDSALRDVDPELRQALAESITRVRAVHEAQRPADFSVSVAPGAEVRQRWIPVQRVGLYVPGGLAVYPSSVIMNVVAAQSAGVPSLAVTSPPQAGSGGLPHPSILAACAMLGVDEVYAVGGAQAIGMLAFGAAGETATDGDVLCEPVNVITGPGNVYVAAAKRLVRGSVGIDSEAGPTEIAILADSSADPEFLAADLISQAEHDPNAAAVLVTDDEALVEQVEERVAARAADTPNAERVGTALGGQQSAIVLVDSIEDGLRVVDAYGAEHLELHTENAAELATRVNSAGAIFVGPYSPVSLGDYMAGSNHVLPTGGVAHYSSGLGVHSYLKAVQVIEYSDRALSEVGEKIIAFARAEHLPAHGEAIEVRLDATV
ncbi:histidinol dehydrogenase [Rarobacter faecitabidus]|uniref:histidinol dehydrogenase n=1 Tax=Rarobacter faecitabidus TaxID=13243 RepID=UPI00114F0FB7|nr:histidinol dehydrogenase [Rarobacter faecitabidus]